PQTLPPIEPSETEVLPLCNPRIARYLEKALTIHPMAVSELLELLVSAGQRVPAKLLPKLLNFGQKRRALQDSILPVIGNRGSWLAAQNPDWSYASGSIIELSGEKSPTDAEAEKREFKRRWEEAERAERYVVFSQWRSVDPDSAREALAATWKAETHTDRRELVRRLGQDVSMADEPFLEAALLDRSKGVREAAAELLATMPASSLCQRMADRISQFVHFQMANGHLTLEVNLPDEYDSDWERDGVNRRLVEGLGEKAGWLQQLVAKAPLSLWPQNFEAMSQCLQGNEWREMLLTGWATAACNQYQSSEAVDWAYALLHQLDVVGEAGEVLTGEILRSLVLHLPMPQREAYLCAYLKRPAKTNSQKDIDQQLADWLRLVAQVPQRWDYDFSRFALKQLIRLLKGDRRSGSLYCPPPTLAMTLHPGLASEAVRAITNLSYEQSPTPAWQHFLDDFLPALSLRWDIYQAFANSS
ncbi:MAG: DUF5691 domain-containing protein, partial [Cyanobacteria bacterium J06635_11]